MVAGQPGRQESLRQRVSAQFDEQPALDVETREITGGKGKGGDTLPLLFSFFFLISIRIVISRGGEPILHF